MNPEVGSGRVKSEKGMKPPEKRRKGKLSAEGPRGKSHRGR